MKVNRNVKLIFSVLAVLDVCMPAYPFEGETHKALTEKAILSSSTDGYLKICLNMNQGLGSMLLLDQSIVPEPNRIPTNQLEVRLSGELPPNPNILDYLKAGAHLEDVPMPRARHHFHSPIANPGVIPPNPNEGLDNKTDHNDLVGKINWFTNWWWKLSFDLTGASALKRATGTEDSSWEVEYQNYFAWPDCRNYFTKALTESNPAARNHYLSLTFLSLGHTVHLLEDMGVPAHARNDWLFGHYRNAIDNGNPFESWVEEKVAGNNWSGTGPVVFDKLSKYFDTDTRDPNDYLGGGVSPPDTWGLAECTNYQFLSTSTVFGCSGVKYQFPHPVKEHTATPALVVYIIDGNDIRMKIYFNGSNYGVPHLARYSYTYYKKSIWGGDVAVVDSTNTPDDVNVFEDYADITIPRTIDYATGLANYFFRGRLNVEPNWIDPNIVKLVITNDSNNSGILQTIKGGTFEIYRDDANDTRTKINPTGITFTPQWTPASILPNDGGLTKLIVQFAPPAERVKKYIVAYKGNISENPLDPDPNDPNAIAVDIVRCGYEIVAWAIDPAKGDKYGQVSDVPEGSDFIDVAAGKWHCLALRSDGSIEAWGRKDEYGEVSGKPSGNDFIAIAAGSYHSLALKSDGSIVSWGVSDGGRDDYGQVTDTPAGNDFVAVTAGSLHSLAIKSDGTIIGWGRNSSGECDAPTPDPGTVYTAIAAGTYHSLALQSDGTVKAWGNNNQGQTRIYDGAAGEVHIAIAACANYSFLLRDDQMLITWGGGDWLEPDIPRYHYRYPDGTDFVTIAAGWDHILTLTSDGEILSWYWPDGDFPFDYFSRTVPGGIIFTDDISAGYDFSLSLKAP
jgi:hypothetical protein